MPGGPSANPASRWSTATWTMRSTRLVPRSSAMATCQQAQFQLGRALDAKGENAQAADAFAKAAERKPQMAYAHYQAGMSFYKAKRVDKMAVYFENFLKLAPNAPESPAVQSIMKTVRGR